MKLGEVPEWSKGADCKSVGYAFEGSNPSLPSGSDPCPQTVTAGGDCFLCGKQGDPPVQQFGCRGAPGSAHTSGRAQIWWGWAAFEPGRGAPGSAHTSGMDRPPP